MKLSKGQYIKAPFLKHISRVISLEAKNDHYFLEAVLEGETKEYLELTLDREQIKQIEIVSSDKTQITDSGEDFFALVEANRIRLAYQFDPLLAISTSQVDPLPHQIEAVYNYALKSPRVRFLIADDPGAGKTIMAGLILKELQYRRLVDRVLIVCPGHLKYQWQRELKEKFNTNFKIINREIFRASWSENVWEENNFSISSIDFLKQEDIRQTLNSAYWDIIIVDEAHKMSASKYGDKISKTARYKIGELLSKTTDHFLLLTATPHKGDNENFRLFLDLLRPGFFAKVADLQEAIHNKENPLFVRRLKEDLKGFDGKKLFLPRKVFTVKNKLRDEEINLYNAVTKYVINYYNQAQEKRYITFTMMLLQRRLTSSIYAIEKSLERRLEKLKELERLPELIDDPKYKRVSGFSEEDIEEMEDSERENIERKLEQLTIAKNIIEVKEEIEEIEKLIEKVKKAKVNDIESKLIRLRKDILESLKSKKLLIFTQFKDTLDYLQERLQNWGFSVTTIHGGMDLDARIDAEQEFGQKTQILIGTEAASEGINLQFCSLMVNYDIPWNPNRLEQRMGRIHRYGQNEEVLIWNIISMRTREGQVLNKLFEKMERMRVALGEDKVFDIVGELVPGKDLKTLLMDAIFKQKNIEDLENEIESIDEASVRQTLEEVFSTSLANRHIDYSQLTKSKLKAEEQRLVPEYIEDYFSRIYKKLGGKFVKRDNYYRIENVPYELRKIGRDYSFKTRYGKIYKTYSKATFDKKIAKNNKGYEFIAPGHPLLEAVNTLILEKFQEGNYKKAAFVDPENNYEGIFWFITGKVKDGMNKTAGKRVFCVYQKTDGSIKQINPAILWDLEYLEKSSAITEQITKLYDNESQINEFAIKNLLFPYKEELAKQRAKEAEIKRKYGIRSLNYLIGESNQKLLDYQTRLNEGEDMGIAIYNEEKRLEDLIDRKKELEKEIQSQSNLTVSPPQFIGRAVVLHKQDIKDMREIAKREEISEEQITPDADIEQVGMKIAMEYETKQGWETEDVSADNFGFDIRSTKYNKEDGTFEDVRYIEVKARAQTGTVRLSSNEWKKARHFKEKFWLYIITDSASENPRLNRIHNPEEKFKIGEDIFASGYEIPKDKWEAVIENKD